MGTHATTLRRLRHSAFAFAVACGALAAPAVTVAATAHGSGGSGLIGSGDGTAPPASTTTPVIHVVNTPVSVKGDGIALSTRRVGETGARLAFTGTASGDAGRVLEIEYRSRRHPRWRPIARATVHGDATFVTRWRVRACGRLRFRALLLPVSAAGTGQSSGSSISLTGARITPALVVTVFRSARATFYGPGFWGHRTACGERLHRTTLGVASRTLRCGTKVAVYYRGREIVVPVIDRGPWGRHPARWDLTMATARAMGISTSVTIGTLQVR